MRNCLAVLATGALLCAAPPEALTPAGQAALARVSADSLRGHVSFLASDALEGRGTPSRGIDIAAEYLAAQFRRAGLEPVAGESYFQRLGVTDDKGKRMEGRNVAALLRGSDAALKDTYVIVSAHYDHLGMKTSKQEGEDVIFNGANDDASGTAAVLEIASALSGMEPRPRRSVLFLLFFGEEAGMFGSRGYTSAPLVPLEKTVAVLNLEQLGRTDEGKNTLRNIVRLTGEEFSDYGEWVERAATLTGIHYEKNKNSSMYFRFADNFSFAKKGVVAHTLAVAYTYRDYHGVGDHWDKLDYTNMAAVTRMAAAATLLVAESNEAPHWNRQHPQVKSGSCCGPATSKP